MPRAALTPFSYAVLALIGEGGAGAHDIVRMLRRGTAYWAAAESHCYAEPKRLAGLGYLAAERGAGTTRDRTTYQLAAQGRDALRAWLVEPTPFPRIQDEAPIRLIAASSGADAAALLASLTAVRADLAVIAADLDANEQAMLELPHRLRYLRLVHRLGRSVVESRRAWLDEVEAELGGGVVARASGLLVIAATGGELAGVPDGLRRLACGVGPVDAAIATAQELAARRPSAVLHVGIAGARQAAGLPLRSLVVGTASVYEDAEAGRWVEHRLAPGAALVTALQAALPEAVALPIGTSARVGGAGEASVEAMEGFAVLRACAAAGVAAVELRVVSNEIEEPDRARWDFAGALATLAEALPRAAAALAPLP